MRQQGFTFSLCYSFNIRVCWLPRLLDPEDDLYFEKLWEILIPWPVMTWSVEPFQRFQTDGDKNTWITDQVSGSLPSLNVLLEVPQWLFANLQCGHCLTWRQTESLQTSRAKGPPGFCCEWTPLTVPLMPHFPPWWRNRQGKKGTTSLPMTH